MHASGGTHINVDIASGAGMVVVSPSRELSASSSGIGTNCKPSLSIRSGQTSARASSSKRIAEHLSNIRYFWVGNVSEHPRNIRRKASDFSSSTVDVDLMGILYLSFAHMTSCVIWTQRRIQRGAVSDKEYEIGISRARSKSEKRTNISFVDSILSEYRAIS